jgi:hypothetical protein
VTAPEVRVLDDEASGLVELLARLLRTNLEADPARARLLRPAVVLVEATDAEIAARLEIRPGRVDVGTARDRLAPVRIAATGEDLLAVAAAPLVLGLPSPFRREGRDVLRGLVTGRVRISGMFRHPLVVTRFARLLSVS